MNHKPILVYALFVLMLMIMPALAQDDATTPPIDITQAQTIALTNYPDAAVVLAEQVMIGDRPAWDVMLDNGLAVYVDANTGDIVEIEGWQRNEPDAARIIDFVPPQIGVQAIDIGTDGVDFNEAQDIALAYYPDAQVFRLDRDRENGIRVWDVMLDNGMAVYINAQTGAIIEFERWRNRSFEERRNQQGTDGLESSPPPAVEGGITSERAMQIALAQFPGTTIFEIKTGIEYGIPVWDIELSNGVTLDIDRLTGVIVEIWGNDQNWENPAYDDDWNDDNWDDDDWDDDDWDDDDWGDDDWGDDDD